MGGVRGGSDILLKVHPMSNHLPKTGEILPPEPQTSSAPLKGEGGPNSKVGRRTRAALDALVSGEADTITIAAQIAGMSREQLSRNLKKPHVLDHLDALRKAKRTLAVVRAETELDRLTRGGRSEYVRLEAASRTLERADRLDALVGRGGGQITISIDLG